MEPESQNIYVTADITPSEQLKQQNVDRSVPHSHTAEGKDMVFLSEGLMKTLC